MKTTLFLDYSDSIHFSNHVIQISLLYFCLKCLEDLGIDRLDTVLTVPYVNHAYTHITFLLRHVAALLGIADIFPEYRVSWNFAAIFVTHNCFCYHHLIIF